MLGFVVMAIISCWASGLLLACLFPVFNFKKEYTEFFTKVSGTPPSQRRLVLTLYGAGSYYFMTDWAHESLQSGALKVFPNRNLARILFFQFASILTALLLWSLAAIIFVIVTAYLKQT